MIKVFLKGNEVIEFNGNMDLRIGQKVKVLGNDFYIEKVESTEKYVKVDISEKKIKVTIDGELLSKACASTICSGKINDFGNNPFRK